MQIIPAERRHCSEVLEIYRGAREFMRAHGNAAQWGTRYPPLSVVLKDIDDRRLFLCVEGAEILGVFCYFFGVEPTYETVSDGAWLNDAPYGVMHRVAVAKHNRGVASFCLRTCLSWCQNLKIDTHRDNVPMQRMLEKNGFVRCGRIFLEDGEERLAYQCCRS